MGIPAYKSHFIAFIELVTNILLVAHNGRKPQTYILLKSLSVLRKGYPRRNSYEALVSAKFYPNKP